MFGIIITLVIILVLLLSIVFVGFYIKNKISNFTMKYFGTPDLKDAIEQSEITASSTPKSVFSVESVSLKKLIKIFQI